MTIVLRPSGYEEEYTMAPAKQTRVIKRALSHARPGKTRDMRMLPWCHSEWTRTGACNLCGTPEPDPIVEHWHKGGERGPIRGLWCRRCNALEGHMKKRIRRLCRDSPVWTFESTFDVFGRNLDPVKLRLFQLYRPFFREDVIRDAEAAGTDVGSCMMVDSSTSDCNYFNRLHQH